MKLLVLCLLSLPICTARSVTACNNVELKRIIDESIVGNNLALSSANIRTHLASMTQEHFVVICDEKPVTFASPDTVFCQRNVDDVFCTVVQIGANPTKKMSREHPPLSSEAIISTGQEKPVEVESIDSELAAMETEPQTTKDASPSPVTPTPVLPNKEPVTEVISETTSAADTVPTTLSMETNSSENGTTMASSTSTSTKETTTSTDSETTLNGDSFFEMMIANQEDARRSMMNTSPPPPLQEVEVNEDNEDSAAQNSAQSDDNATASSIE